MKREIMKKQNAINYLKRLHELEDTFKGDLLSLEKKELVELLRAEFLKAYQGRLS